MPDAVTFASTSIMLRSADREPQLDPVIQPSVATSARLDQPALKKNLANFGQRQRDLEEFLADGLPPVAGLRYIPL